MRRHYGILATLALAYAAVGLTPATAQNDRPCCRFSVIHNFRLCLPEGCQRPQVTWNWNTQAAAWQIGSAPVINTNNGTANYFVPSSGNQCAQAQVGSPNQTCALAQACASFNVSWISGTNCLQGSHTAFGTACALCRRHGANAAANSHIVISCPNITQGTVVWTPQFQDSLGSECGVQMYDPVIIRYRNPLTGGTRDEVLFDLRASNFEWTPNDDGATAKGGPKTTGKSGYVTLMKARMAGGSGQESRIHIRWDDNMIVTEAEATGEFSDWQLPNVGDTMPLYDDGGVRLPGVFDLPFVAPSGWVVEGIEMGGGGVSGQDIPRTPGDVDGNGCVDDADLLQVLFAFGGQGGAADVNGDGIVDDADLLIVLFNFGTGC
jgi:hypothetical protein